MQSSPGADTVGRWLIKLGTGPSLSVELPVFKDLSVGAGVGSPVLLSGSLDRVRYSSYLNYQVLNQNGFYISGVLGVYGDYVPDAPSVSSLVSLQGGAAFAYDLNKQLTLRINIVPGFALQVPPTGWSFLSPAGGILLVWSPTQNSELSVGFNGLGDVLNFGWAF